MKKTLYGLLGCLLVIAGVVLLVLPGPGLLLIVLGLATLAGHSLRIRHMLHRIRARLSGYARGRRINKRLGERAANEQRQ